MTSPTPLGASYSHAQSALGTSEAPLRRSTLRAPGGMVHAARASPGGLRSGRDFGRRPAVAADIISDVVPRGSPCKDLGFPRGHAAGPLALLGLIVRPGSGAAAGSRDRRDDHERDPGHRSGRPAPPGARSDPTPRRPLLTPSSP